MNSTTPQTREPLVTMKQTVFQRRRMQKMWALVAAAMPVMLLASACSSGGKSGSASGTAKSYCAGRTVTFLAPDDPGGNSDVQMRVIAPAVSKILGCTVHVTDAPQGNTVVGQDLVAQAKPDGLTLGYLQVSKDLYNSATGGKSTNFSPESVEFVASTQGTPNVIIASPSSPYKSFQDMINSSTQVPVLSTGGSGQMTITLLMAAYGKKPKIITGYSSQADVTQGFLRGDGPITNSALSGFVSIIKNGKARPILLDTAPPQGDLSDLLKDVPTYADVIKQDPPSTSYGDALLKSLMEYRAAPSDWYFMPAGTPQTALDQMSNAFKGALTDPAVQKKLADSGVSGYVPGSQGLMYVKQMESIVPYMKQYATP